MKILIVANNNTGKFSPFVVEQVDAIRALGVEFDFFGIVGKGWLGYLKNLPALKRKIKAYKPDLIHAHYGLSGLLATLQTEVPVIVTYHGSDIHTGKLNLYLSRIAMRRAAWNIIVSSSLYKVAKIKRSVDIIPCGVDDLTFYMINKNQARKELVLSQEDKIILFAGAFERAVKNPQLAKEAVALIYDCKLIELKGYTRAEVNLLLNAADCLLMTSVNEGSPQIIKEAMLCGTSVVSVNVGDVKEIIGDTEGCYIAKHNADDIADKIRMALAFKGKTNGRKRIIDLGLSNDLVAKKILSIYNNVSNLTSVGSK